MSEIPVKYKDRREEGDTPLRQCQLVQLHLLHVFAQICSDAHLCYFLDCGTLLGAMRHDGFIPWDDDLDVGMPRSDYEKFLKIASVCLPSDVMLVTPKDIPNAAIPYSKLRDKNSFYGEARADMATLDPSGIFIDIFPYDDLPNVGKRCQLFLTKACASSWKRIRYFYNQITCNPFSALFYIVIAELCRFAYIGIWCCVCILNKCLGSAVVVPCLQEGYSFVYKKEFLFPAKIHRFEDAEFAVPRDSDAILTAIYGNWRQIPPVDKRPRHARIIDPFRSVKG